MKRVYRQIFLYLCVCLTQSIILFTQTNAQVLVNKDKQQMAEVIGDRIVQRLHETLDFKTVLNEFFVTDPNMRSQEMEMVFGNKLDPRFRDKIDSATIEKGYVAIWNLWYLMMAYVMVNGPNFEMPAGFGEAYESMTHIDPDDKSSGKEYGEMRVVKLNLVVKILRDKLSPEMFNSDSYKTISKAFKEPEETANAEQMRNDFGLSKSVKIYVVKREFFNYFLLEEKGQLRVFTLSLRTKDRL